MSDLVSELNQLADMQESRPHVVGPEANIHALRKAAEEIDRLRGQVEEMRSPVDFAALQGRLDECKDSHSELAKKYFAATETIKKLDMQLRRNGAK